MEEFPIFQYSRLGWIKLRNECGIIVDYLHSQDAMRMDADNFASNLFWKEAPQAYRGYEVSPLSDSTSISDIQWTESDEGDSSIELVRLNESDNIVSIVNLNE